MTDTIYELRDYDLVYDTVFYRHFKNDDTVVQRIKRYIRKELSYDAGYYDDQLRNNCRLLHLLKSVDTVDELMLVLSGSSYTLELKTLL